jgi:hypothetical protein
MSVKRIVCGLSAAATIGAVSLVGFGAQSASAATCPVFPYAAQRPTLTLSTDAPAAGQTILVSGCGFTPGATVSIFLLSRHYFLGEVVVDPNGGFDIPVRIPRFFCGAHRIAAVQHEPRQQARALVVVFDCDRFHHRGHHHHGDRYEHDWAVRPQHQAPQPARPAGVAHA